MVYERFSTSIDEAISLLKLSQNSEIASSKDAQLVLRSSVVLSVAFWQNYHESCVQDISSTIMQRCRDSAKLPKLIRKEVAKWLMQEQGIKKNPERAALLVWEFAGGKWRSYYTDYVKHMVSKFNTPNTENINALYASVLGLEKISDSWPIGINGKSSSESIDCILDIRHRIAHGSFRSTLSYNQVLEMIECLRKNVKQSYECASSKAAEIMESFGKCYSFNDFDLSSFIKWLAANPDKIPFAVADLSKVNNNWYANHKKLSHISWDLLEGPATARKTTEKFSQFIEVQLALPYEIISFGGKDSMPKPGTKMVYFADL